MNQGNIESFIHLSQFKNVTDFNNNIEQWMIDVKGKFTKSELVALKRLVRFSAKVCGVCNAKIGTLVSATHENNNIGISRSTFKRMLSKAKAFGLLVVTEMERRNGSQSSNLYVFNRYESAEVPVISSGSKADDSLNSTIEPPKDENLNHPKTSNLLETNKNKNIKKRIENDKDNIINNKQLGKEYVSANVPEGFVNLVSSFYGDFQAIEEFWKMVKIAERKAGYEVTDFDLLDVSLNALKESVKALKINKVKNNVFAFFYGTMQKMLKKLYNEFYKPKPHAPVSSVILRNLFVVHDMFVSKEDLNELGVY
jgi:hypothetical protein